MNPRGPDGKELHDPKPCKGCGVLMVFIQDPDTHRHEPIEWNGGRNHFLTCPKASIFGQPKRPMNWCYKHVCFYRGLRCWECLQIERASEERKKWRRQPPLEKFG